LLETLDDAASRREVEAERSLLATLEAGCRAPIAGLARVRGERLTVSAAVFSPTGATALREEAAGLARDAAGLGRAAGRRLLERGAAALMAEGGA
jgi:hydroxymethylbilane synthase